MIYDFRKVTDPTRRKLSDCKFIAILSFFVIQMSTLNTIPCKASPYTEWNAIGVDRKNNVFFIKNWPLGIPTTIVSLRISLDYILIPHSGVMSLDEYVEKAQTKNHTYFNQPIIIDALLPDFAPREERSSSSSFNANRDNEITIYFAPTAMAERKGEFLINGLFEAKKPLVVTKWEREKFGLKFGVKESRFGLERLGPIGNFEPFRTTLAVDDLYFLLKSNISVFLICPAEEIRDITEDPSWIKRPVCDHYFFSSSLESLVKLTYRRVHLQDWRRVQASAEALLTSFKKSK